VAELVRGDEKLGVVITKVLYCPPEKVTEHCDAKAHTSLSTPAQQIMSEITAKKYLKIK